MKEWGDVFTVWMQNTTSHGYKVKDFTRLHHPQHPHFDN